jgi:predicted AlkP superfamily phosphohydrolase/phosphomutase
VEPGQEYERLRDRLIEELGELRAPATGNKLVRRTYRREELMAGPFLDEAPDLLIDWADHTFAFASVKAGPGPVFSTLGLSEDSWHRTGDHDPRGILLVRGEGIEPGRELPACNIMDVLPTAMYAAGEPVPEGLDGRVLEEAFSEAFRSSNPLSYFHSEGGAAQEGAQAFTGAEDQEVAEHLRGLGYLD